ncbi:hypothetical protein AAMO2058_001671000 [Amorphochlora amoebiformis]
MSRKPVTRVQIFRRPDHMAKTNPKGSSSGINPDGSLMNVGNKLGANPSIRLYKDKLSGGSGNAMKNALTDEAMGISNDPDPEDKKAKLNLKAMAKRKESEQYIKLMDEKRKKEGKKESVPKEDLKDTTQTHAPDPFIQKRLIDSIESGFLKGIKTAVADGASVTQGSDDSGWTSLHYAAAAGKGIVVKYLISQGADKKKKDIHGQTPYQIAFSRNKTHVLELLEVDD